MYPFEHTALENKRAKFEDIRNFLNSEGFEVGGNWENTHGYFDKKLQDNPGYLFLRIPVFVEEGIFGEDEALVRMGTPFLIRHKYQRGLDDYVSVANSNATFNQFAEPVDPDADLEEAEIEESKAHVKKLEQAMEHYYWQ